MCWDEHNVKFNESHAEQVRAGVSWVYNWGPDAAHSGVYDSELSFAPMAWNGAYDSGRIRSWLDAHPESRYLLGFNEPNFADQAKMTPAEAARLWPELEALAAEYGVRLVAPALNFPLSSVGGRIWSPYEWYDEFFRLYPEAHVDCLAMHSYMNWYSANTWLATEYFYSDLYDSGKECYGRYPHLAAFLERYKSAHGHFPRMMLTEFCSWENDGMIRNVEFQIDQMTQKVQKLEQSDLVEGYAWFIANAEGGATSYPYMSLYESNSAESKLSELGRIYVHMSDFDMGRYYAPDEDISATDYVDATTDERMIRLRDNSDSGSETFLQAIYPPSGYATYLTDIPETGAYRIVFRVKSDAASELTLYVDSKKASEVPVSSSLWHEISIETTLSAGKHTLMPYNSGGADIVMSTFKASRTGGVKTDEDDIESAPSIIYGLNGIEIFDGTCRGGAIVIRRSEGSTKKVKL